MKISLRTVGSGHLNRFIQAATKISNTYHQIYLLLLQPNMVRQLLIRHLYFQGAYIDAPSLTALNTYILIYNGLKSVVTRKAEPTALRLLSTIFTTKTTGPGSGTLIS